MKGRLAPCIARTAQPILHALCLQSNLNKLVIRIACRKQMLCSDTSDTDLAMQGLWGPGSPFADFKAFLDSMKSRGVSFLEMLAMEMKSEGYYVARGLSFT